MKKMSLILITIITFTSITIAQSVIVKDSETEPNTLLEINDEGATGSISIPTGIAPSEPAGKLYNEGGTLKWNGSTLSTGGNTLDQAYDEGGAGLGRTITADAGAFNVGGVDGALFTGTYGVGVIPTTGAGIRMMWYPKKAAFRVGYVSSTQWDDGNIGSYSTAIGVNTIASEQVSTAMGSGTTASGTASTAMGGGTIASGTTSTAMGYLTTASGEFSTAMGIGTDAIGKHSTAMGFYTTASGYISTALGRYNVGGGNATSWIATDPLFEIGIGTGSSAKANAMTVLKNGNVGIGTTNPTVSSSKGIEIVGDSPALRMRNDYLSYYDYAFELISTYNDPDGVGGADPYYFFAVKDVDADIDRLVISDDGNVGIGTATPTSKLSIVGLSEYADNAKASGAGLVAGDLYRTGDILKIVH